MNNSYRAVTHCRVCDNDELYPYLDLGLQPLANAFRDPADVTPELRAPLQLQFCAVCGLSQLTAVVDPKILYTDYAYSSGVNPAWAAHCADLLSEFDPLDGKFVLDIGSNDGTLLKEADRRGSRILGVEPSAKFAICGVPMVTGFWGSDLARRSKAIANKVDLLTAMNVIGHVDNVHDFMEGVALALQDDGTAIFEAPSVSSLLQDGLFDTIYHEHVSYWCAASMRTLLAAHGLVLVDIAHIPVHGGSLRYYVRKRGESSARVLAQLRRETLGLQRRNCDDFCRRVSSLRADIAAGLSMCDVGLGAAAKATVLLNATGVSLTSVFDDTPAKIGKLMPGTNTMVRPFDGTIALYETSAVLAWNWAPQLMERAKAFGFRGKFFVPLPQPRWICYFS